MLMPRLFYITSGLHTEMCDDVRLDSSSDKDLQKLTLTVK
jgi:hypothetical protein